MDRHAVVIGGSIAGLVTARVLADHFNRVTIIERDDLPESAEPRTGVPQALHVHVLLQRGQKIAEQLFPDLQTELAQAGAPRIDWLNDVRWLSFNRWGPRFPSNLVTQFATRGLLEYTIRRRLALFRQIQFIVKSDVVNLLAGESRTRITGVRVHHRDTGSTENVQADLIVDASGRESKTPQWLEALDYARPTKTWVNSFLGYSSRLYRRPKNFAERADWKGVLIRATPPASSRGAVLLPVEGDRWMVTLGAGGKDYPPTDEAGWLEFARSLPTSIVYDTLKHAEPLSPIRGYRRTENRWRHYERLERLPENLIVLGDAVCAFNPVYGQGMTVATMGAHAHGGCLRKQNGELAGLTRRFQRELARLNQTPWLMATSADFLCPETEGERPSSQTRFAHAYLFQVGLLTMEDRFTHQTFIEVAHLVKPPSALFQPRIATRVFARWACSRSNKLPTQVVPMQLES